LVQLGVRFTRNEVHPHLLPRSALHRPHLPPPLPPHTLSLGPMSPPTSTASPTPTPTTIPTLAHWTPTPTSAHSPLHRSPLPRSLPQPPLPCLSQQHPLHPHNYPHACSLGAGPYLRQRIAVVHLRILPPSLVATSARTACPLVYHSPHHRMRSTCPLLYWRQYL
jgi:hypothetical protein